MSASRFIPALACGLLAAGCTTIEERLPPGSSLGEVRASMGTPAVTCALPDGGERLVWSGQPSLQASWATNVAADGTTSGVEQVLTDASFNRLREGTWGMEDVRCAFGPPAIIDSVGVPGRLQRVWSYAYKQDTVWNSLMFVFFDDAGYVTRFHPGPDPAYDPDRFLGFGFR